MISDKIAIKAINALGMYCLSHSCSGYYLKKYLKTKDCPLPPIDVKFNVGCFEEGDIKTSAHKPPKFDVNLENDPDFREYLRTVLDRALNSEYIDSQDLTKLGLLTIKIQADGRVMVGLLIDGKIKLQGSAKCHPNDAFNIQTGVRLAVHRMVEKTQVPFNRKLQEVYYFIDYDGNIISKPWGEDVIDSCNLALSNCFNSTVAAWFHITTVKKGIRHLADALKMVLPASQKKDGD